MADAAGTITLDAAAKAATEAATTARSNADAAKVAADKAASAAKAALSAANADLTNADLKKASEDSAADAASKKAEAQAAADAADAADAKASAAKQAAGKSADAKAAGDPSVAPSVQMGFFDLCKAVVLDEKLTGREKRLLIGKLRGISPSNDIATFRWAIWILGAVALLSLFGLWSLTMWGSGKTIPDGLVAIGSGAAGALAGLLNSAKDKAAEPHT